MKKEDALKKLNYNFGKESPLMKNRGKILE